MTSDLPAAAQQHRCTDKYGQTGKRYCGGICLHQLVVRNMLKENAA